MALTVVIPTYRRKDQLLGTLHRILSCSPPPEELIVHVDAGDSETALLLERVYPHVRVLSSAHRMGPGGGRNKAIAAASHSLVASFDDDSYPIDADYFGRALELFERFPDASVIAARVTDRGNPIPESSRSMGRAVHFGGGGVVLKRDDFLACGGFVPLEVAYGMEEVDVCLRLVAAGKHIYLSPWLRVFHDNDLAGHSEARVTAAAISNQALLAFLRYPPRFWVYGAMQVANRVWWLTRVGRMRGIATGLARIPLHLWRNRRYRAPVSAKAAAEYFRRRRAPSAVAAFDSDTTRGA